MTSNIFKILRTTTALSFTLLVGACAHDTQRKQTPVVKEDLPPITSLGDTLPPTPGSKVDVPIAENTTSSAPIADSGASGGSTALGTPINVPTASLSPAARNAKSDMRMSSKIRRAIVKDKSLSSTAKNVSVTAQDGFVTLNGEVTSEDERLAVEKKAEDVAGISNVMSKIEIKP